MNLFFQISITPKSVQFGGKRMCVRGGKPVFFRDKASQSYLDEVALKSRQFRPREAISLPIELSIVFYMPRPAKLKERFFNPHLKRPDLDNLAKPILDVLTREKFWLDDNQVFQLKLRKEYANSHIPAGIHVKIFGREDID